MLQVLVVCGCDLPKQRENEFRQEQTFLIRHFTKYTDILQSSIKFITLNVENPDDHSSIIFDTKTYKNIYE